MKKEKSSKKSQAHQRYKLADGTIVPGVTTITGLRAKPFLVKWANDLGLQGVDSTKYVDEKAEIGTVAHYLILCHLKKEEPVLTEYSSFVVDRAENSYLKYLEWEKRHTVEMVLAEQQLVSEKHRYGGCVDFYGVVDGALCLVDFKTSKSIYPDHFYQLAGYKMLLTGAERDVEECRILRIGRSEEEGFEERTKVDLKPQCKIFMDLLDIYYREKEIAHADN